MKKVLPPMRMRKMKAGLEPMWFLDLLPAVVESMRVFKTKPALANGRLSTSDERIAR